MRNECRKNCLSHIAKPIKELGESLAKPHLRRTASCVYRDKVTKLNEWEIENPTFSILYRRLQIQNGPPGKTSYSVKVVHYSKSKLASSSDKGGMSLFTLV